MKMNSIQDSRETILAKIKATTPQARSLPEIPLFDVSGDVLRNFLGHLKGFDGSYKLFTSREEAVHWLQSVVSEKQGTTFSNVGEVEGNTSLADFKSPSEMHVISTCVAEAILGVGETGSLLVDNRSLGNPAAALFSTDLFLLINRRRILKSIQEAYSEINLANYQYSSFFSGPSATADIEAVHITGAQGEISLTAVVYNCSADELETDASVPASTPCAPIFKRIRETDVAHGQDSV